MSNSPGASGQIQPTGLLAGWVWTMGHSGGEGPGSGKSMGGKGPGCSSGSGTGVQGHSERLGAFVVVSQAWG